MIEAYSVLMSVYKKAVPNHFFCAVKSMIEQTVMTDDFVIVCDGPLTIELDNIINEFVHEYPDIFNIVRLEQNVGIGKAANIGLGYCKNDLIAKMDADDVALVGRCEAQLRMFFEHPNLAVIGGYISEFDDNSEKPFSERRVPIENEEICKFARRRQPFNNMTVMYRKAAVKAVGGYRDFRRSEDYDLYVRLLNAGYQGANIPAVLVNVRVDKDAQVRRTSWQSLKGCVRSRWCAYRCGFSSLGDFLYCSIGGFVLFIVPGWLQQRLYMCFFRQKIKK